MSVGLDFKSKGMRFEDVFHYSMVQTELPFFWLSRTFCFASSSSSSLAFVSLSLVPVSLSFDLVLDCRASIDALAAARTLVSSVVCSLVYLACSLTTSSRSLTSK